MRLGVFLSAYVPSAQITPANPTPKPPTDSSDHGPNLLNVVIQPNENWGRIHFLKSENRKKTKWQFIWAHTTSLPGEKSLSFYFEQIRAIDLATRYWEGTDNRDLDANLRLIKSQGWLLLIPTYHGHIVGWSIIFCVHCLQETCQKLNQHIFFFMLVLIATLHCIHLVYAGPYGWEWPAYPIRRHHAVTLWPPGLGTHYSCR